ncbi:MAG: choice-of-anchor D domain-containing protein [Anaerolineales bacterium]|nr:choice-of-anchor D domain-containing protein [Anaerolineales bacterium]
MSQSKSFSKVFLLSILCLLIVMLFSTAAKSAPVVAQSDPQPADEGIFTAVAAPAGFAPADLGPEVLRSRYVVIDDAALDIVDGVPQATTLQVNLFSDVVFTVIRDKLIANSSGSFTWIGHSETDTQDQIILTIYNGMVFGHISSDIGTYGVTPAADQTAIHLVAQVDESQFLFGETDARTPFETNNEGAHDLLAVSAASDGSLIDVLIIYTDDVATNVGVATTQGYVDTFVAYTNQAYENSDVNQRIQLVGFEEITYTEPGDLDIALDDITPSEPFGAPTSIAAVEAFRNEYHADLVLFLVNDDGNAPDTCAGLAWVQTTVSTAFQDHGYSAMKACSFGSGVFAHELGHNMGGQHDWYVNNNTLPFSYAHGYVDTANAFRTIMSYNNRCSALGGSCTRINYFSNPSITYNGNPIGIAGGTSTACIPGVQPGIECDADMHTVLNSTAATVDTFRDSEIVWTGTVDNDWNNASNWQIQEGEPGATSPVNRVPRSIDDVLIPSTPTGGNFPQLSQTLEVRDIVIENGASFTISGGTLTVYGNWEEQGTGTTTANGGTVVFAGSLPQTISTSANSQFNHLQIGNGGSTAVTLNSDLDVNGNITIQTSAQLFANSVTLNVAGNWNEQNSTGFSADTSTVIFDGISQTMDKTTTTNILDEDFSEGDGQGCGCNTIYLPANWTRESAWFGGEIGGSGVGFASGNGWLHSPAITLLAGADYNLLLDFGQLGGTDTLRVYYGTLPSSGNQTNVIGTINTTGVGNFNFTVNTSGIYYIGFHHDGAGQSTIDNVLLNSTQKLTFHNLQISSTNSATPNQPTAIQNNLTTNNGGTLNINGQTLTVEGTVTNNGTVRDTKAVSGDTSFAMIQNAAADTTKYYGLDINNVGGDMGSTTVDISGGQDCGLGAGSYINRCYDIIPTTPQSADITFWFSEADRGSENASTSTAWHWNGASWDPASSTATYNQSEVGASCTSNGGLGCSVEAEAVTTYSPFALGGDNTAAEIAVTAAGTNITNGGSFDFGSTIIGTPISQSFTISNTGISTLTLANLAVPAGFAIESSFGLTDVPTDTATTFVISLTATAVDSYSGTLSFDNNDPDEDPFAFTISGDVLAEPEPEISVTAAGTNITDGGSFALGITTIGTPISQSFTISNSGTTSLTLANLTIPAGFTVTQSFSATVGAGLTTTLGLQLEATAVGSYSGDLSVDTNDSDENPFNFTLSGEVLGIPEIEVTVDANPIADGGSVDFGPTLLGEPITQTFTISNTGSATLTLANLTVPAGFAIAADFGVTAVPTDTSTTFVISLTATAAGNYSGTLSFDTNDPDENPFDIVVEGTVTAPDMVVIIDSAAITNGSGFVDFGSAVVGNPITKEVTIQNNGTAALIVSDFSVPNGFTLTAPLSATIPVSSETAITLTLEAAVAGIYSGTVSFTTNDAAENPFAFTVEGTVTNTPEAEIQVLDGATNIVSGVGTVDLGTTPFATPVMRVLTIRNAGTAALSLGSLTVPDGYTAVFSDTLVAPSDSTLLTVTLTAEAAGTFSGTLSFVTNDTNENPFSFEVTGVVDNPPDPEITLFNGTQLLIDGVSEVDFGTVLLGEVVTRTFTVENNGPGELLLSDLAVTGSGFIIASDFATTTVASGDATTFTIELDTAVVGEFAATVSFANNDANENPFSFTVVGTVFEEEAPAGVYLPVIIGN